MISPTPGRNWKGDLLGEKVRLAVGSDERTNLTDAVLDYLKQKGHEVELYGALAGENIPWTEAGVKVAEAVTRGEVMQGIIFCWTGTGVTIAANKVQGVRAALCGNAECTRGARKWNHANILTISLCSTSEAVAKEILDAWFSTPWEGGEDARNIEWLKEYEKKQRGKIHAR